MSKRHSSPMKNGESLSTHHSGRKPTLRIGYRSWSLLAMAAFFIILNSVNDAKFKLSSYQRLAITTSQEEELEEYVGQWEARHSTETIAQQLPTINSNASQDNLATTSNNSSKYKSTKLNNNVKAATNNTHLIIHVGPVKTGSSSIQCNLQVNPYLKNSSYEFVGRREDVCAKTHHRRILPEGGKFLDVQALVFRYILRGWLGKQDKPLFRSFVDKFRYGMDYRHKQGIHSIISGEEFCGMQDAKEERWQDFADLLNGLHQDVSFQVVYRDYFDWAVSKYSFYEIWDSYGSSFSQQKSTMHSVVDDAMTGTFTGVGNAGCHPYSMWSLFRSKLSLFQKARSVDVFNMHGEGDMVTRFICSLPNAEAACKGSKELKLGKSRPTDNDKLHADRIATAAWKRGMFFDSSAVQNRREHVNRAIKNYVKNDLNSTFLDLPLECLQESKLTKLWNTSVQHGEEMLGSEFDVDAMRAKFDSFVAKKKFCSVNVTEILMDPSWKLFFKNETRFDLSEKLTAKTT